jgi:hypothetical protein
MELKPVPPQVSLSLFYFKSCCWTLRYPLACGPCLYLYTDPRWTTDAEFSVKQRKSSIKKLIKLVTGTSEFNMFYHVLI